MKAKYALIIVLSVLIFLLLIVDEPNRGSGHISLLAVSDDSAGSISGSIADLYVEIRPGNNRVFIDTFPVSKLDTQLSTRFAKDVACQFTGRDCSNLDFFYTFRSPAPTIGGPSAGAAVTVLTISVLQGLKLKDDVLLTGTINSGNMIGPVGGIPQKVQAAASINASKVLVGAGSYALSNEDVSKGNDSLLGDVKENVSFGNITLSKNVDEYPVPVIEVSDLRDAVYEMTDWRVAPPSEEIVVPAEYKLIMHDIAVDLCNRSTMLLEEVSLKNSSEYLTGQNLSMIASSEFDKANYYTAASRCFGANIWLKTAWYKERNYSVDEFIDEVDRVEKYKIQIKDILDNYTVSTVTDLQTYIIVDERLRETEIYLKRVMQSVLENESDFYSLAYSFERLNSARTWSMFFGTGSHTYSIDSKSLKSSCLKKVSEAEERMQYVRSFIPFPLEDYRADIDSAINDYSAGNYELCLFRASKAKAELDVIVSVLGVKDDDVDLLLQRKLSNAKNSIVEEISRGNFPILGFSYYEYAGRLPDDKYSALIYAEYALELSSLELYLNGNHSKSISVSYKLVALLLIGILMGLLLSLFFEKNPGKVPSTRASGTFLGKKR